MSKEYLMVGAEALRIILGAYESCGDAREDAAYDELFAALNAMESMKRSADETSGN